MGAITLERAFRLFDATFDYLLVLDGERRILHVNDKLAAQCGWEPAAVAGETLAALLPERTREPLTAALARAEAGEAGGASFWRLSDAAPALPLKIALAENEGRPLILLWGNEPPALHSLAGLGEASYVERAKELACIYAVAEWVEVSPSIAEFFAGFPRHMREGMQYPDHAVVFASYQGEEYGERPAGAQVIRADLVVGGEIRGELMVGYDDLSLVILPDEQRLLDELARMLNLALDRKQLSETLAVKRGQLDDERAKLSTVNSYLDRLKGGFEESQARLQTMFEAIPDMVAIIDRNRNVIMTNRKAVPTGSRCHKTFFDSDTPCMDCRLKRIIREKTPITLEVRHGDLYYEVNAMPIFNKQHEVDGIIEFYRDVTYKRTYEQQLQQADKLASLGQLVSGIGHEINNPNQFIRGNVKIIQQAMDDILPILDAHAAEHPDLKIARLKYDFFRDHIGTLISDMANGSERIKRIVEALKRFARKDEGELIDKVDVNTVIDESARLVHNQVHKFADIELDLASELPPFTGNAQKLEQVLINLIINASQAMPEGRRGTITVATRHEDGDVVITVADDGKGMSERTLKQIFDPFFTTKRAKGGTGLGLSIVYRIIEEHHGRIAVSSQPGQGTTFTITLPLRPGPGEGPGGGAPRSDDAESADR